MNRNRSIEIIFLIIVFLYFLITPSVQAAKQVVIGFVLPLSGSSSDIGAQIKFGASMAASEINNTGGVASLAGAKLILKFGDSKTHPMFGVSETERLIKSEEVSVLCGAYNSFVTLPATAVAEKYKTPWVVTSSVMDEITERGFRYIFRPCNTTFYDAREQMEAIELFSQETGKRPMTIGQLYEASKWGRSHAVNIRKLCQDNGYYLIVDEPYLVDKKNVSNQLSLIRKRKPDLMIVALYTQNHILFSKQYMENRVDIPFGVHSVGAGSEDPLFYEEIPKAAAEYMFVQEDWQIDRLETMRSLQILNKKVEDALGYSMNAYGAQGYSNVWLIYDALERCGSTDKEKIRDALSKTRITSGPALITGYQEITFDENGQNVHAHGVVSQNQNGKRITLWPMANRLSGKTPIWPIPSWSQR